MIVDRLVANRRGKISVRVTDENGDPADVAVNTTVTATITDAAGTALAGSPYEAVLRAGATGIYDVVLPAADLAVLGLYDVVWTFRPSGATDNETERRQFRVEGAYLFSVSDVRAFDKDLVDTDRYTSRQIAKARSIVESRFERIANRAFTPQRSRFTFNGSGTRDLWLPRPARRDVSVLRAASISGVAIAGADLTGILVYPEGRLQRPAGSVWTFGERNVVVDVEYGMAQPPDDVWRAGLSFCRYVLTHGGAGQQHALQDERATAVFTDIGGYRLSLAGRDGPTGLPEVDAVLADYSTELAGFA